jgi:hypothetical protein
MPFISSVRGSYGAQSRFIKKAGLFGSSGGTITTAGPYTVHTFTTVGTTTFNAAGLGSVEYLIVAGGGGGGGSTAGGGGAGGLLSGSMSVNGQAYSIVVGNFGNGSRIGDEGPANNTNGGNSTALGLTAIGGGYGYSGHNINTPRAASSGGSGGGGGGYSGNASPQSSNGGSNTPGQGFPGGNGINNGNWGGGGGGGAGSAGGDQVQTYSSQSHDRRGGSGLSSSISGSSAFYAGGGGGGCEPTAYNSYFGRFFTPGGSDIGGRGGEGSSFQPTAGLNGTGSGGGGGGTWQLPNQGGGRGGSGIVIIRYIP